MPCTMLTKVFFPTVALSKTVFIERKSRSQAVAAFDKAAEQMHKHRQSVYIFPEGTRSYYDHPDLLPFKKGAFYLAVQAGVPIVPVVVANYSNVLYVQGYKFNAGTIPIKGRSLLHCRCSNILILIANSSEAN